MGRMGEECDQLPVIRCASDRERSNYRVAFYWCVRFNTLSARTRSVVLSPTRTSVIL